MRAFTNPRIFLFLTFFIYIASLFIFLAHFDFTSTATIYSGREIMGEWPNYQVENMFILEDKAGFDGQYYFYMAKDLVLASNYVHPVWFQRIGLPSMAKVISLGNNKVIPQAMIVINLLALAFGAYFLLKILAIKKADLRLSFVWILNAGAFIGLMFNLTEPLSFFFLLAGLYVLEKNENFLPASLLFSSAILSRETSIAFVLPLAIYYLLTNKKLSRFWLLLPVAILCLWQVILKTHFGFFPIFATSGQTTLPFVGLWTYLQNLSFNFKLTPEGLRQISSLPIVTLFLYQLLVSLIRLNKKKLTDIYQISLFIQLFLFSLLPTFSFASGIGSTARYALGWVLFSILCYKKEETKYLWPVYLGTILIGIVYLIGIATVFP